MRKITAILLLLSLLLTGCSQPAQSLETVATTTATTKSSASNAAQTTTAASSEAATAPSTTTAHSSIAVTTLPTAPAVTTAATTAAVTTAAATTAHTTLDTTAAESPEDTDSKTDTPAKDDTTQLPAESDDTYVVFENSWVEICDPFNEKSAVNFAKKMESIREKYPDNNAVLALIPDKTFYKLDELDNLGLDHTLMTTVVSQNLSGWSMVELSDLYTWESFYQTDLHWRQELLLPTAERIGKTLGITIEEDLFTQKELGIFHGIYEQYAETAEETLIVLDHPDYSDVTVEHYENSQSTSVYDLSKADSANSYDVFLSGASPYTVITNPNAESGTSLLVFRDSFGASLVPLLIPNYETITMVDLRFMHSTLLSQFIPTWEGDILFLYSARVVNNSAMLR